VETTKPDRRALVRALALPATLEAYESADLYAKVSGYVGEVAVDIGSRVRAGDGLIRIEVPEMADELRQAEAVLASRRAGLAALQAKAVQAARMVDTAAAVAAARQAELDLQAITTQRKEELFKGTAIPRQEIDEARSRRQVAAAQLQIAGAERTASESERVAADADVKVAEAEVAVAEAQAARLRTLRQYTTITAPFDGVITVRRVDPGDFVRSAEQGTSVPLLTLASVDRLRLVLEIPESDCRDVLPGTTLDVRQAALAPEPFTLEVARTARALNPATRTMRAEADLPNSEGRASPGMYAQVVVRLETKAEALLVPSRAIHVRGEDVFVLAADDGVARALLVELGYDDGEWAEIVSGLSGAESVILAARGAVTAGMPVQSTGIAAARADRTKAAQP